MTRGDASRGYLEALKAPGVLSLIAAGAIGRLPLGMTPLGIVLLSRDVGHSYGVAGVMVGAYTLGSASAAPMGGRAVDRLGPARVLVPLGVAFRSCSGGW